MVSRKRNPISFIIMACLFGLLAFMQLSNMDFSSNKNEAERALASFVDFDLEGTDLMSKLIFANNKDANIRMVPSDMNNKLAPVFDFLIKDKIVITMPLAKDFYDYGFAVGDVISKVDGVEISGSIKDVYNMLYSSKLNEEKTITVSRDGASIDIKHQYKRIYNNTPIIEQEGKNITIKPFYLDSKTVSRVASFKNSYDNIIIDLGYCYGDNPLAAYQFCELFISESRVIFSTKSYKEIPATMFFTHESEVFKGDITIINYDEQVLNGEIIAHVLSNAFSLSLNLKEAGKTLYPVYLEVSEYMLIADRVSWEVLNSAD